MMKFTVKDCDPTTGEADEEGYEDEYVVSEEGYEDEDVVSGSWGPRGSQPVCTRVLAGFRLAIVQEFLLLT